jgi:hypothetical protein
LGYVVYFIYKQIGKQRTDKMTKGEHRLQLLNKTGLHNWTAEELQNVDEHDFWVMFYCVKDNAQKKNNLELVKGE